MIKSHIIGRLGRDAEEATQGQRQVLRFRMATDDREKDASGQWQKKTVWVAVSTGQMGLKPYLTKGKQVLVSGDLHIGLWHKSDGNVELDCSVFGADVTLLGGDNAPQTSTDAPQSTSAPQAARQPATQPDARQRANEQFIPGMKPEEDDQLPF